MTPTKILAFLDGKKTYLSALVAILYLAGCLLKYWDFDEKVLAAIGFSGLAFLRAGVNKGPALLLAFSLLPLAFVSCTTATATKVSADGTSDTIKVKAFLSTIQDGTYHSAGSNGITLTVTAATPDQQAIATLAGGVVELSKAAMVFAARAPTNAPPATNSPPQ